MSGYVSPSSQINGFLEQEFQMLDDQKSKVIEHSDKHIKQIDGKKQQIQNLLFFGAKELEYKKDNENDQNDRLNYFQEYADLFKEQKNKNAQSTERESNNHSRQNFIKIIQKGKTLAISWHIHGKAPPLEQSEVLQNTEEDMKNSEISHFNQASITISKGTFLIQNSNSCISKILKKNGVSLKNGSNNPQIKINDIAIFEMANSISKLEPIQPNEDKNQNNIMDKKSKNLTIKTQIQQKNKEKTLGVQANLPFNNYAKKANFQHSHQVEIKIDNSKQKRQQFTPKQIGFNQFDANLKKLGQYQKLVPSKKQQEPYKKQQKDQQNTISALNKIKNLKKVVQNLKSQNKKKDEKTKRFFDRSEDGLNEQLIRHKSENRIMELKELTHLQFLNKQQFQFSNKINGSRSSKYSQRQKLNEEILKLKQKIQSLAKQTQLNISKNSSQRRNDMQQYHFDSINERAKGNSHYKINFNDQSQKLFQGQSQKNKIYKQKLRLNIRFGKQLSEKYKINFPHLQRCPSPNDQLDQLVNLGIKCLKAFGLYDIERLDISKFYDCIHYVHSSSNILIIWYFSGKFHLSSKNTSRSDLSKESEGFQYKPNQYIYKGNFRNNKKHGRGIFNYQNGNIYVGKIRFDEISGQGILFTHQSIYEGNFKQGKKNGYGKQIFENDDQYKGNYVDDKPQGFGEYRWKNGTYYYGQFNKGEMEGEGFWQSVNGDTYEGQYFKNMKHGHGIYQWKNGAKYEGKFQRGKIKNDAYQKTNVILMQNQISYFSENSQRQNSQIILNHSIFQNEKENHKKDYQNKK